MTKTYTFEVLDADDGTEDKLLQLSEEFLADHDWRSDDVIQWDIKDGAITMRNKTWEKRNEDLSKQAEVSLGKPVHDT
jgi:hypothetical protein